MANGLYTVILKPTKLCNADCNYCCAPPDGAPRWSMDDFQKIFAKLAPHLADQAVLLWHGGEPMVLGPDFYRKAYALVRSHKPGIRFSLQTNLLLYDRRRWRDVMLNVFDNSVSTSYDPDGGRTLKGNAQAYTSRFFTKLEQALADGIRPTVIGTFGSENASTAEKLYDMSLGYGDDAFTIRLNYRYPVGRARGQGALIAPEEYGAMLVRLYDRWISEMPTFTVIPLSQMLTKVLGIKGGRCPWTKSCGGRFLAIEPNGDTYQCGEFSDLGDPDYRFGNIWQDDVGTMLGSRPAVMIQRRRVAVPTSCTTCRHFGECEGGCMRDSVLYNGDIAGKFYYCQSWMMVFDRIKASIASGEADAMIRRYHVNPDVVRARLAA